METIFFSFVEINYSVIRTETELFNFSYGVALLLQKQLTLDIHFRFVLFHGWIFLNLKKLCGDFLLNETEQMGFYENAILKICI